MQSPGHCDAGRGPFCIPAQCQKLGTTLNLIKFVAFPCPYSLLLAVTLLSCAYNLFFVNEAFAVSSFTILSELIYFKYFFHDVFAISGARGDVVVKALRYKPACRRFDSRWCHWNFSVT